MPIVKKPIPTRVATNKLMRSSLCPKRKPHMRFCSLTTAAANRFLHISSAQPTKAEMIDVM